MPVLHTLGSESDARPALVSAGTVTSYGRRCNVAQNKKVRLGDVHGVHLITMETALLIMLRPCYHIAPFPCSATNLTMSLATPEDRNRWGMDEEAYYTWLCSS